MVPTIQIFKIIRYNTTIQHSSDLYGSAPECFKTCSKLQRARVPLTLTKEAMMNHFENIREISFIPGTQKMWPGIFMTSFISITDEGTPGVWRDWYTGENIAADGYEWISGGIEQGKKFFKFKVLSFKFV